MALLPAGPARESGPFLTTQGIMLNQTTGDDEQQTLLALAFAKHLTNLESQTLLMTQANQIPSNVNVDTSEYPAIAEFLKQAETAVTFSDDPNRDVLFARIDKVYNDVLNEAVDPIEAIDSFFRDTSRLDDN